MKAFRMTVAYRGECFCGWQKQKKTVRPSVQEVLEKAVSEIFQQTIGITGAGRTDAGVHSLGQVAAFQVETSIPAEGIRRGINRLLPESARVLDLSRAEIDFHPRYQAKEKTYRYLVHDGITPNPLLHLRAHFVAGQLDIERMRRVARCLTGKHDFSAFQGSGRKALNTVRTIFEIEINRLEDFFSGSADLVAIMFRGDGYLFRMARNMAGTLIEAGLRRTGPEEVSSALDSRDRRLAGPTAPAHGLTLMEVRY